MKILITGANGQLGNEFRQKAALYPEWTFIYSDLPELDITNREQVDTLVKKEEITVIVNCAAYTAVDKAEGENDKPLAFKVNVTGPKVLAEVAKANDALLIHVSTDFVFNGKNYLPYKEDDIKHPLSVYGQTKLDGELAIQTVDPAYVILRTSWLYSIYGNNFVKTMLRLGKERTELGVIFDQVGTPTWANDLATAILVIIENREAGIVHKGIYHYSNEGVASWYDFSTEIMDIAGLTCMVKPIETSAYPTPASRPHYSVLNKAKIKSTYNLVIPHWKVSLKACMKLLNY
jgi:dTDP-4-dehydrorhamnose reductase